MGIRYTSLPNQLRKHRKQPIVDGNGRPELYIQLASSSELLDRWNLLERRWHPEYPAAHDIRSEYTLVVYRIGTRRLGVCKPDNTDGQPRRHRFFLFLGDQVGFRQGELVA